MTAPLWWLELLFFVSVVLPVVYGASTRAGYKRGYREGYRQGTADEARCWAEQP